MNWRYLPQSKEVLWYSRKDDWGALYLNDASTGMQKNRITAGEGNVTQVMRVEEAGRTIYFQGVGKEAGRDPYFRHLYKIGFDGKNQTLLTPEDGDHDDRRCRPPGATSSTPIRSRSAAVSRAARRERASVVPLEKADITQLVAAGWKPPMPITVKAATARPTSTA